MSAYNVAARSSGFPLFVQSLNYVICFSFACAFMHIFYITFAFKFPLSLIPGLPEHKRSPYINNFFCKGNVSSFVVHL